MIRCIVDVMSSFRTFCQKRILVVNFSIQSEKAHFELVFSKHEGEKLVAMILCKFKKSIFHAIISFLSSRTISLCQPSSLAAGLNTCGTPVRFPPREYSI
jgi:hypothetical protein